jgi:deoxyadenosine kinase
MKEKFIGISGNIGAGKTTFCEALKRLSFTVYDETVKTNPYLDDFYANPSAFALTMQKFLFNERLKATKAIMSHGKCGVQDRTIYEDKIFVSVLAENGTMSKQEQEEYEELFVRETVSLDPPDLLIYFNTSPATCMERIKKRGRECEKSITLDYITRLHKFYVEFVDEISRGVPVFVVGEHIQDIWPFEIIEKIKGHLAENCTGIVHL